MKKCAYVLLVASTACGANVVFVEGGSDPGVGGQGGGADEPSYECVLGSCGEPCTKCIEDICFSGACTEEGRCDPESAVVCAD